MRVSVGGREVQVVEGNLRNGSKNVGGRKENGSKNVGEIGKNGSKNVARVSAKGMAGRVQSLRIVKNSFL